MKFLSSFILITLLLTSCQPSKNPQPTEESLKRVVQTFNQYFKEGNVDGLRSMTSEDYSHTTGINPTIDKATWLGYMEKRTKEMDIGDLKVLSYEMDDIDISLHGSNGVVTGKTTINSMQNGKEIFISYQITMFWTLEDNEWKRTAVHYTQIDRNHVGFRNELKFHADDSTTLFADLYTVDQSAPTLLLFHQAGANARGEYDPIIPRLIKSGYNVIAVDQRSGGQSFGQYNRAVLENNGKNAGYCEAFPDLPASVRLARENGFNGKLIVWGSSYSAALVIKLAHDYPDDVSAVLAFSPASGDPMGDCNPNALFEDIDTPLLVLRPDNEMQYESVKKQFEIASKAGHDTFIAENGVHGSSMLVEDRTKSSTSDTWAKVDSFLAQFKE